MARFLVLGKEPPPRSGTDATSVLFGLDDRPGRLANVLDRLAAAGVNLRRIASRPTDRRGLRDLFFVDLDGHRSDPACRAVLEALAGRGAAAEDPGVVPARRRRQRDARVIVRARPAAGTGRRWGRWP